MSRFRRALVAAAVVVGLALLAVAYLRPARSSGAGRVGERAPLFDSTDLSGRPIDLSSYRGHRVILNFWSSSCIPCRTEFPVLQRVLVQHPDVVVLGVVFEDFDASASAFMRAHAATWPGVRDPRAQIANAYGVYAKPGIPVSILISPAGRIVARLYGGLLDQAAANQFVALSPPT